MKKILSYVIIFCMLFSVSYEASAVNNIESITEDTATYIYQTAVNPQVGSIGGEWAVFGLARSGYAVSYDYYNNYYKAVEEYVEQCEGKLSERKYTEYARLVLALTAIGKNPADVAGYNLLLPLSNYEKTIGQGLNGAVWALLALDCGKYNISDSENNMPQDIRNMYVEYILQSQLADGGWSLSGKNAITKDMASDTDMTAMAIASLAKYRDRIDVQKAVEKALSALSDMQNDSGGFASRGIANSQSTAQVIIALCELGIPVNDSRFVKKGNNLIDNMLEYYQNNGAFKNSTDDNFSNQMASEQALCALIAIERASKNKSSLYSIADPLKIEKEIADKNNSFGLTDKHEDITHVDKVYNEKTFSDILGHKNQIAVEALAMRGIINGKTDDAFEPDKSITRAEFAAVTVRALGLPYKTKSVFADIADDDWYFDYINTAYAYGIVSGLSDSEFNPNGIITREEAVTMTARAAELCGMNTNIEYSDARDILAGFTDYINVSEWAVKSAAFCCENNIIDDSDMELKAKAAVTRGEIAEMLFNLMRKADLL